LDPTKAYWKEYVFGFGDSANTVDDGDSGMDDVSAHFATTMNDLVYCPLSAY